MRYRYNVKPGDVMVSELGTSVLVRETRHTWFFATGDRMGSMTKSELWLFIDMGFMDVHYAEGKKYRRFKKSDRVLDMRDNQTVERLEDFVGFVKLPFHIAVNNGDMGDEKIDFLFEKVRSLGYSFSVDGKLPKVTYIKVTEE